LDPFAHYSLPPIAPELLFEFLLTYRTFSSGVDLCAALTERFLNASEKVKEKEVADIIRVRFERCFRWDNVAIS